MYDKRITHGLSNKKTYKLWSAMKNRCFNDHDPRYKDYGGRGITVCSRWKSAYIDFYNDLGDRPKQKSLDRIDNDGHYSCGKCQECIENRWPMNCRWATAKQQAQNRRQRCDSTHPGIYISKRGNKYRIYVRTKNKSKFVGSFFTYHAALKAGKEKQKI